MIIFPKEIENIILDYKYQIEHYVKKRNNINRQIKRVGKARKRDQFKEYHSRNCIWCEICGNFNGKFKDHLCKVRHRQRVTDYDLNHNIISSRIVIFATMENCTKVSLKVICKCMFQ